LLAAKREEAAAPEATTQALAAGFLTVAQGDIPFVARVRMEAYAGECCDAEGALGDDADSALHKQCILEDLCLCLAFSGDDLWEKCRSAFTKCSFIMLQEDVNAMEPQRRCAVEEAHEHLLAAALAVASPHNTASPS